MTPTPDIPPPDQGSRRWGARLRRSRAISPVLAIARLTMRNAVRNGSCAGLLVSLIGITVGVPMLLQGDGTLLGQMRLVLSYPTAIAFAVLLIGTVWMSAGLIALDISGKQLQAVAVKPVRAFDILFGKWLGLMALDTGLAVVTALGLLLTVALTTRHISPTQLTELRQRVLVGRRTVLPTPVAGLRREAERLRQDLIARGRIEAATPLSRIYQDLKTQRAMVRPGKSLSWTLALPPALRETRHHQPLSLQFQFRCNALERTPISGVWTVTSEGGEPLRLTVRDCLDGTHHLMLPASFQPAGERLSVAFSLDATDEAPSVFFDPDTPVALLIHESSFTMNLVRTMLAILSVLAVVAALGLTMSTLFSLPVAVFATGAILYAVALANGFTEEPVEDDHGMAQSPGWITKAAEPLLIAIKHATRNIVESIPIAGLADGILFSWPQAVACLLVFLLLIPLALLALSALMLSQKELAA